MECDRRDLADDVVEVCEHFAGWVAEDLDVLGDYPGIAGCVSFGAVAVVVGFTVDLDREPGWGTVEVQDVSPCSMLPSEAQACLVAA